MVFKNNTCDNMERVLLYRLFSKPVNVGLEKLVKKSPVKLQHASLG